MQPEQSQPYKPTSRAQSLTPAVFSSIISSQVITPRSGIASHVLGHGIGCAGGGLGGCGGG